MASRTIAIALSSLLVGLALAGCTDADDKDTTTSPTATSTPTPQMESEGSFRVFGLGVELIETMQDPEGVPFDLLSVFAISNDYFHCVIVNNDHTFTMPTAEMGNVTVPADQLYMAMDSVSVESLERVNDTHVVMKGKMRSITRVGADVFEDAIVDFTAEFSDGGPGFAKDTTVLKPVYTAEDSPIQKAIFGAEPHFGHGILSGDIRIQEGDEADEGDALLVEGLGVELIETMKDPDGVPFDLLSVFAMSNDFFHCVIATNDHTFTMPTAEMGNATVPKNALWMAMDSVSVDSLERINATHVEMKGKMRSITRVGPDVFEDAIVDFTAEFSDGGPGFAKDTTVLKPVYTAEDSPVQKAIFGAEPHFGHGILSGDIRIG